MKILVTGGAGFIGFHTSKALLEQGHDVVIVDNFNDYYSPKIKEARVAQLLGAKIVRQDFSNIEAMKELFAQEKFDKVCHLGAQAGVRYSLTNPYAYLKSNSLGTLVMLECCRHYGVPQIVLASSSSVYGMNTKMPFSEDDPVNTPMSIYGETKRANELQAFAYHHLYGLKCTCLRFFSVYGEFNRPDLAAWKFTKAILAGQPIEVYNHGEMKRDWTYVGDVVRGIIAALNKPFDYEIINLGNNKTVQLNYFISLIEKELGKTATKNYLPMQAGDVPVSWADISKAKKLLNWEPHISIEEGVHRLMDWVKENMELLR
ncbi:MAG: GDP-mannose 4,6-dehydratase [Candidatus Woesearchaeota archaeon]|nr:GDP-mannose 4,6-dehydratase [Candidatus Woesearchaeota archaeon]